MGKVLMGKVLMRKVLMCKALMRIVLILKIGLRVVLTARGAGLRHRDHSSGQR